MKKLAILRGTRRLLSSEKITKKKDRGLRGYARINTNEVNLPIRAYPTVQTNQVFVARGNVFRRSLSASGAGDRLPG
jgi:hypothetical protein